MATFLNISGYPLVINALSMTVGPDEEFEWPGYNPAVDGVVTGCEWLDAPQTPAKAGPDSTPGPGTPVGQQATTPPPGGTPASGTGQPGTGTTAKPTAAAETTDSGKEN